MKGVDGTREWVKSFRKGGFMDECKAVFATLHNPSVLRARVFFEPWGGPDNDEIEKVFADEDVADQQGTLALALVSNRIRRKLVDLRG